MCGQGLSQLTLIYHLEVSGILPLGSSVSCSSQPDGPLTCWCPTHSPNLVTKLDPGAAPSLFLRIHSLIIGLPSSTVSHYSPSLLLLPLSSVMALETPLIMPSLHS